MRTDEKHVLTGNAIVLWDGITQPETDPNTGTVKHTIKVALLGQSAERQELEALARECLNASEFKGALPPGGNWPVAEVDLSKFTAPDDAARLSGHVTLNAATRNGAPPVYDANGNELSSMAYGRMFYPGAVVRVIVHAFAFNNKSKGVAFGLDGVQVIDATAPRLSVGGGLSAAAVGAMFGAAPAAQAPAAQAAPAPVQPPAPPVPGFVNGPAKRMTAKAQGASYDQFVTQGWTDEQMIAQGYLEA